MQSAGSGTLQKANLIGEIFAVIARREGLNTLTTVKCYIEAAEGKRSCPRLEINTPTHSHTHSLTHTPSHGNPVSAQARRLFALSVTTR